MGWDGTMNGDRMNWKYIHVFRCLWWFHEVNNHSEFKLYPYLTMEYWKDIYLFQQLVFLLNYAKIVVRNILIHRYWWGLMVWIVNLSCSAFYGSDKVLRTKNNSPEKPFVCRWWMPMLPVGWTLGLSLASNSPGSLTFPYKALFLAFW